jgi:hypothetical protein
VRRRPTPLTSKRAFETIKIIARAMLDSEIAITYSDLASRLGMPNDTGRGLGAILDEAALKCKAAGLPNVTSVVVTKESLIAGKPMPSEASFNSAGIWPLSGTYRDQIPDEQERVRAFDWRAVRPLNLSAERKE